VPGSVKQRPAGRDQQECTARHGPRLYHVLDPQPGFLTFKTLCSHIRKEFATYVQQRMGNKGMY